MAKGLYEQISEECSELKDKFDEDHVYRTMDYRHTNLSNSLVLAGRMADELRGIREGSANDEYKAIMAFAWGFAESLRHHVGDARLYGALREVEELASRLVRDAWFEEQSTREAADEKSQAD